MYDRALKALSATVGHEFADPALLEQALRHPSFTHENSRAGPHNQRLEFLGDAVLGLVVAEALLARFPDAREGDLTRFRAAIVNERSLSETARRIDLGSVIVLGRGEESQGGRTRPSVLADAFEALVGAAFLDGGLEAATAVVRATLGEAIDRVDAEAPEDHKSLLQERVQARGSDGLEYALIGETGPDHDKRFEVELRLGGRVVGRGAGTSKKLAEQAAARDALHRLDEVGSE